ncbi:glycosyl hydrolase 108 family protein [Aureimonas ureilytica]|uniref:glycosyl hydrolase 108 family protein n=1 Tax=Aureimonas ureilytica TaxID=401562 RepID=UPI000734CE3A|nr:glycosyl hydrolase 108 family protein [Aureimonas ureilytica]
MDRFADIMTTVLECEGGYVNNPFDNGGPTNFGITHKDLAAWRGAASVTPAEVKALTKDEAIEIYRKRYWGRIWGDRLPQPVDFVVMDGAVSHGVAAMLHMLETAAGLAMADALPEADLAAIVARANSDKAAVELATALAEARKKRYLGHEDAAHFINGWRNRLNTVMAAALEPYGVAWTFDGGVSGDVRPGGAGGVEATPVTSLMQSTISDEDLQRGLEAAGVYTAGIDGMFGEKSVAGMNVMFLKRTEEVSTGWQVWSATRRKIALGQLLCKDRGIDTGRIDGLYGQQTLAAFEAFNLLKAGQPLEKWRDEIHDDAAIAPPAPAINTAWPRQSEVPTFFGPPCKPQMKRLELPFRMRIAWDLEKEITGFMIHEKVHDSAARVFEKIWRHYGEAGIREIGMDLFGGCYNCRKMKGGSSWSMHSWAIAIDFDPARNQLKWSHLHARLAKPDATKFWEFWEEEGWLSLGRARDFDWMHVQAARL